MYKPLSLIFHTNKKDYNNIYLSRLNADNSIHIDFNIHGNQAFFLETPDILKRIINIHIIDKQISKLSLALPLLAFKEFSKRCLIDEIVLSNKIEGVNSTRREIDDVLNKLQEKKHQRFTSLVNQYELLISEKTIDIKSPKDIRDIYDKIALQEIMIDSPEDIPDGELFRKDSVSVTSPTGKEIHNGSYPESKIIEDMDRALSILNDPDIILIERIAIFHYLFGYIHPFYDGNGRTSRFISSYMLSRTLEPLIGYRLSYTIQENIKEYYEAFKTVNEHTNMGDLTPFVEMFIKIVEQSLLQLHMALNKRLIALLDFKSCIDQLPFGDKPKYKNLYYLLIQASLFSENGISTKELFTNMEESRSTLMKQLENISDLVCVKVIRTEKYYHLDLKPLEKMLIGK